MARRFRGRLLWSRITSWYSSRSSFTRNISWTLRTPLRERVELLAGVEAGERGAGGGRDAEALHHRLRAVVPGAHGDALAVEDRADVVRVDALEHEGEHARLLARRADEAQARAPRTAARVP